MAKNDGFKGQRKQKTGKRMILSYVFHTTTIKRKDEPHSMVFTSFLSERAPFSVFYNYKYSLKLRKHCNDFDQGQ